MKFRITAFLTMAAIVAAFATAVPGAAKAPYSQLVVFGTSLSDTGNAFALRGGTNTPPDYQMDPLLVPGVPYARGGHHFTNGPTWIEQFARSRGLAGTVRPAFASDSVNATNYAVAAARAYEDGRNVNLSAQVEAFLQQFGQAAPDDALYVVEMGGNDIRDALGAYVSGRNGSLVLQMANVSIAENIQRLYAAGARQFLVWRAPNVGVTPALRMLDYSRPGAAALATTLTVGFNHGLDTVVAQLSAALPDISIARLDAYQLIGDIVAHPAAYGLTNVTTACVTPGVAPFVCERPDEFLFWDGIHPTRAVHAIAAQLAADTLGQ